MNRRAVLAIVFAATLLSANAQASLDSSEFPLVGTVYSLSNVAFVNIPPVSAAGPGQTYDFTGGFTYDAQPIQYNDATADLFPSDYPTATLSRFISGADFDQYLYYATDSSGFWQKGMVWVGYIIYTNQIDTLFVHYNAPNDAFTAYFLGSPDTPLVTISGINYKSEPNFDVGDWVELHNYGASPWPELANGQGRSLELLDPYNNLSSSSNWFQGCFGGSPGVGFTPCVIGMDEVENGLKGLIVENYPNPLDQNANIFITTTKQGLVRVRIVDLLGNQVAVLHAGQLPAGRHYMNYKPEGLSSGIYYLHVQTSNQSQVKVLSYLKQE